MGDEKMNEEKLDSIFKKLAKLDEMDERLKNVEANMTTKLESDEIKQAVLETNKIVKQNSEAIRKLTDSQVRQDKILESLAARSLEQETDIKNLKHIN